MICDAGQRGTGAAPLKIIVNRNVEIMTASLDLTGGDCCWSGELGIGEGSSGGSWALTD